MVMAQKVSNAPREWYRIAAKAEDASIAEIDIYDFIGDWIDGYWGFGITAKQFLDQLAKLPEAVKTVKLRINSPGGDVYSATAIANLLRDQQASKSRTVEVLIDGMAASAATIITSAGSTGKVSIADNALMFVHNPWTIGIGNAKELRKAADDLDKMAGTIVTAYRWRSSLTDKELAELMDAETLMDADEAIGWGFADQKIEGLPAMACAYDPRGLPTVANLPEKLRAKIQAMMKQPAEEPPAPQPADAAAVLAACKAVGCLELAEELITAGATTDQVTERTRQAQEARAATAQRETEIRALCAAAKCPELADTYVNGGMPVATIKAQLTIITAKQDKIEIDASLSPDAGGAAAKTRLNSSAIYAERNARAGQRGA
jgi:ATP-dependent protease ClpP protease subunit